MEEFRVLAIEFMQKSHRFYLFHMPASQLVKLVSSRPKTSEDVEGIQRLLDRRKLAAIASYVSGSNSALPNNIIISFTDNVRFERNGRDNIGHIVFPSEDGHYGDILDGQHRLYGVVHDESQQKEIDLPVTGLMLSDRTIAGKIFADINSNQTPVSKVLLVSLQRELGLLPEDKDLAAVIVERLNADEDSPLHDRIKMFQDVGGKYLNNDQMMRAIVGLLDPLKTLRYLPTESAVKIIKDYFKAIATVFPHAWNNDKLYNLARPGGIGIMLELFDRVKLRTGEVMPSESQFVDALEVIKDTPWDAETFKANGYTSSGGRARLRDELALKLPPPTGKNL